jgi:hypothetical protein
VGKHSESQTCDDCNGSGKKEVGGDGADGSSGKETVKCTKCNGKGTL